VTGKDHLSLLGQLDAPQTSEFLKELAEVEILRQIGEHHYEQIEGGIRVLDPKEMPEAAYCIESPYEVEARYSTKRSMGCAGYKVHLTESCDEGFSHLITDVHTTAATDVKQLTAIQQRLAKVPPGAPEHTLVRDQVGPWVHSACAKGPPACYVSYFLSLKSRACSVV
jgi:transposase